MPSGKLRVHTIIGRQYDDRLWNISYFLSFPIFTDLSRSMPKYIPTSHEIFLSSPLDRYNLNNMYLNSDVP